MGGWGYGAGEVRYYLQEGRKEGRLGGHAFEVMR